MEIEALVEKWRDVIDNSDDWTEKNLAEEFITDLRDLAHGR